MRLNTMQIVTDLLFFQNRYRHNQVFESKFINPSGKRTYIY